jgi:hypothetical protein
MVDVQKHPELCCHCLCNAFNIIDMVGKLLGLGRKLCQFQENVHSGHINMSLNICRKKSVTVDTHICMSDSTVKAVGMVRIVSRMYKNTLKHTIQVCDFNSERVSYL